MDEKFAAVRKGLLEFAILRIIAGERVYVADMLVRPAGTPFATQEGTPYPLPAQLRPEEVVDHEWVESEAGPPRKYYHLTDKGTAHLAELSDYWRRIDAALDDLGR